VKYNNWFVGILNNVKIVSETLQTAGFQNIWNKYDKMRDEMQDRKLTKVGISSTTDTRYVYISFRNLLSWFLLLPKVNLIWVGVLLIEMVVGRIWR
jgi:hypothetical protein